MTSANTGTAAASKNPRMIAATAPDFTKFVHQGTGLYKPEDLLAKGLCLGKIQYLKLKSNY